MRMAMALRERTAAPALALAVLTTAATSALATPTFDLAGSSVAVGQPLHVTARAADIADLFGFQLTLNFDPSLVQFVSVDEGSFLRSGGSTFFDGGSPDNVAGTVSFVFDTLVGAINGVTGSGDLARFEFASIRPGLAAFTLSDVLAVDSSLNTIGVQTRAAALGVPEPSTVAAVLLGMLSLVAVRRRAPRSRGGRLAWLRSTVTARAGRAS